MNKEAKVKEIIKDGIQNWWPTNTIELNEIKETLILDLMGGEDQVVWIPNAKGTFTTHLAWEELRSKNGKVAWCRLIWFKKHISCHGFISWLAIKGKLMTRDKLLEFGFSSSSIYLMCNKENDA
ncbi:uncharacterized protein LOC123204803 [Mangifera indica]|uniref:uncharacterized protein LOC123204803 n=1 Tax=Mangifera indica TaxID=29780 RepID=UPI001CFB3E66|nr:uncharacterized protein LOC123204803 [Mangifera indica]